jgi:hypothetical protein
VIFLAHDGVAIAALLAYRKLSPPAVVAQGLHLYRLPAPIAFLLP